MKNLEAGGFLADFPNGRSIFANKDNSTIVWVNFEDHLRAQFVWNTDPAEKIQHIEATMR
eukprot:CAMPEP_0202980788 /NCGR_PEP_ID=MMETSP1396-20130829/86638_1 /ASSEMBLY_ACC=CAM_ASM_000872 /TAXON_ID= /ORGANISM="Pseudokeronopsis sp., Strain Brazil" /LENGTH=59 /DNA_ID=CAMNT_0049720965 /DNA_START=111 /DNA_END=290 /DNA_ORIENTATION=+